MTTVARYAKAVAHPGQAESLVKHLLAAAEGLRGDPGCLLYLINREKADPGTIWVTEVWRSEAALAASLEQIGGSEQAAAVMALVKEWQMTELEPLGGKGPGASPGPGG